MPAKKAPRKKAAGISVDEIRKKLGHVAFDHKPSMYLNTGSKRLNGVMGHPDKGLAYGKMIELVGMESNGKTALALTLLALAQQDGAQTILADLENSWDPEWAAMRGLDPERVHVLQPYVGKFGDEKEARLCTSQELLTEVEGVMSQVYHASRASKTDCKLAIVVDSTAALLTEEEASAGLIGSNMRSRMSVSVLLQQIMRRWVGLAQTYNALVIFINQMRVNPMQHFGDPHYVPGGNAPRFFCHVRVKMRRVKSGLIPLKGKTIGLKGLLINFKNKAGGLEGEQCGYKLLFRGPISFISAEEAKGEGK